MSGRRNSQVMTLVRWIMNESSVTHATVTGLPGLSCHLIMVSSLVVLSSTLQFSTYNIRLLHLDVFYLNSSGREIVNDACTYFCIPFISDIIDKRQHNFMSKLKISDNQLILTMLHSPVSFFL